ncbi:MAG: NYN domain-containing protein [Desulfovibrio sp.]|nr:NYN domain-containing protein [Desulfovibrio sp.]
MERVAIFIDAGYFWGQLSQIVYGEPRNREDIVLKYEEMRESLLREVEKQFPGYSLLRIYWYDALGMNDLPSRQHKHLGKLDDVKMRYGTRNTYGKQKGVDGLLMADLILLAQNKAITSAVIVSGDADLIPGVTTAQMLGVRVHRMEINGQEASSPALCEEVDRNSEWPLSEVENFASAAYEDGASGLSEADEEAVANLQKLTETARQFIAQLAPDERMSLEGRNTIPFDLDKKLLFLAKTTLGRLLYPEEKRELRNRIFEILNGRQENALEQPEITAIEA